MATVVKNRTGAGTLTANTVTSITITNHGGAIEVVNRTQSGEIWVRVDGVDPVVEGDGSFIVVGARHFDLTGDLATAPVEVRMLSTAATKYAVEGAVI